MTGEFKRISGFNILTWKKHANEIVEEYTNADGDVYKDSQTVSIHPFTDCQTSELTGDAQISINICIVSNLSDSINSSVMYRDISTLFAYLYLLNFIISLCDSNPSLILSFNSSLFHLLFFTNNLSQQFLLQTSTKQERI